MDPVTLAWLKEGGTIALAIAAIIAVIALWNQLRLNDAKHDTKRANWEKLRSVERDRWEAERKRWDNERTRVDAERRKERKEFEACLQSMSKQMLESATLQVRTSEQMTEALQGLRNDLDVVSQIRSYVAGE